jgi:hypothetical protein
MLKIAYNVVNQCGLMNTQEFGSPIPSPNENVVFYNKQ